LLGLFGFGFGFGFDQVDGMPVVAVAEGIA
jgi:hypothetical protein